MLGSGKKITGKGGGENTRVSKHPRSERETLYELKLGGDRAVGKKEKSRTLLREHRAAKKKETGQVHEPQPAIL